MQTDSIYLCMVYDLYFPFHTTGFQYTNFDDHGVVWMLWTVWVQINLWIKAGRGSELRETDSRIFLVREVDDLSCDFTLTNRHRSLTGPPRAFHSAQLSHIHIHKVIHIFQKPFVLLFQIKNVFICETSNSVRPHERKKERCLSCVDSYFSHWYQKADNSLFASLLRCGSAC